MKPKDRNALRDKVGLLSAYLRSFQPDLGAAAPVDAEGRQVFVSCLADDSVHDAVRLVTRAGGKALVLVFDMVSKKDGWSMTAGNFTVEDGHADGDCSLPVGPSCTMADLIKVLGPGASLTIRLADDALIMGPVDEHLVDRKVADLAGV